MLASNLKSKRIAAKPLLEQSDTDKFLASLAQQHAQSLSLERCAQMDHIQQLQSKLDALQQQFTQAQSIQNVAQAQAIASQVDTVSQDSGMSVLATACRSGSAGAVKLLLAHSKPAPLSSINTPSLCGGLTPLMYACLGEHVTCVELLLLDSRIAANQCDAGGCTALHHSARLGNLAALELLASHQHASKHTPINSMTSMSSSGANTIDQPNTSALQHTPLHVAVLNDRQAVVQYLIKRCANSGNASSTPRPELAPTVNLNKGNAVGDTALHLAARLGNGRLTALLVGAKASLKALNHAGQTPQQVSSTDECRKLCHCED